MFTIIVLVIFPSVPKFLDCLSNILFKQTLHIRRQTSICHKSLARGFIGTSLSLLHCDKFDTVSVYTELSQQFFLRGKVLPWLNNCLVFVIEPGVNTLLTSSFICRILTEFWLIILPMFIRLEWYVITKGTPFFFLLFL